MFRSRIKEVRVEDLNDGDHIAVERNCLELHPLFCPVLPGGKYLHHGIFDQENAQVIKDAASMNLSLVVAFIV